MMRANTWILALLLMSFGNTPSAKTSSFVEVDSFKVTRWTGSAAKNSALRSVSVDKPGFEVKLSGSSSLRRASVSGTGTLTIRWRPAEDGDPIPKTATFSLFRWYHLKQVGSATASISVAKKRVGLVSAKNQDDQDVPVQYMESSHTVKLTPQADGTGLGKLELKLDDLQVTGSGKDAEGSFAQLEVSIF